MPTQIFISFILWIVIGAITAYLADQRKRSPLLWFFIGMLLGVFGLLILLLMPKVEEEEGEPVTVEVKAGPVLEENPFALKMWFYLEGKDQIGPLAFDKLKREWKGDKLLGSTYVWSDGMSEWMTIDDFPALKDVLSC